MHRRGGVDCTSINISSNVVGCLIEFHILGKERLLIASSKRKAASLLELGEVFIIGHGNYNFNVIFVWLRCVCGHCSYTFLIASLTSQQPLSQQPSRKYYYKLAEWLSRW